MAIIVVAFIEVQKKAKYEKCENEWESKSRKFEWKHAERVEHPIMMA